MGEGLGRKPVPGLCFGLLTRHFFLGLVLLWGKFWEELDAPKSLTAMEARRGRAVSWAPHTNPIKKGRGFPLISEQRVLVAKPE
jgi:hypothetical protein